MSLIAKIFGEGSRLSVLEKLVLGCIRERLPESVAMIWDRQIDAINKVQRLPCGTEVDFYRLKGRRPSFDRDIAFPNRSAELHIAEVQIELDGMGCLPAKVWCVNGFLFSIEYGCSIEYFEEAAGMDPRPELKLTCDLTADLASM